mmetsp:Transcript_18849/g.34085  ORF Transcript_18849/g.34085 Transcript_18849/m.34085 type:complete len:411 (+) Transcript_18849:95-1327(+)
MGAATSSDNHVKYNDKDDEFAPPSALEGGLFVQPSLAATLSDEEAHEHLLRWGVHAKDGNGTGTPSWMDQQYTCDSHMHLTPTTTTTDNEEDGGMTLLHIACDISLWPRLYPRFSPDPGSERHHVETPSAMVRWLVTHGADPDARAYHQISKLVIGNATPLYVLCRSWGVALRATCYGLPWKALGGLGWRECHSAAVVDAAQALVVEGGASVAGFRDVARPIVHPGFRSALNTACKEGMPPGAVERLLRHGGAAELEQPPPAVSPTSPDGWSPVRHTIDALRFSSNMQIKVIDNGLVILTLVIGHYRNDASSFVSECNALLTPDARSRLSAIIEAEWGLAREFHMVGLGLGSSFTRPLKLQGPCAVLNGGEGGWLKDMIADFLFGAQRDGLADLARLKRLIHFKEGLHSS